MASRPLGYGLSGEVNRKVSFENVDSCMIVAGLSFYLDL